MKEIKRRLAAIMFTDIVGYTAMMQKDELIAARLRDRHREVFKKYTEKHGGKILQYYGDGTLSIYPSSSAAVECGIEIQRELKREPTIPLRIGIHTGEISYSEEDIYGDGVNIASRIEGRCIPGGVFISEKVYDDIKNNSKFKTTALGKFPLKNVLQEVGIYAISNDDISVPEEYTPPVRAARPAPPDLFAGQTISPGTRNKFLAGLLAITLGIFGTHRFYLGQKSMGIAYLAFTMAALFVATGLNKFLPVVAIVAFVEGILLWSMPKADFEKKYNRPQPETEGTATTEVVREEMTFDEVKHSSLLKTQLEKYKDQALLEYRRTDYPHAIELMKKAIEIRHDDPEAHFMLARCYSLNEEAENAMLHLDAAVAFGLKDQIRIITDEDFAYLRSRPIFEAFSKNSYRLPKELPPPEPDLLQTKSHQDADLLEQLNKLKALREKGILTEEEFERLKPKYNQE